MLATQVLFLSAEALITLAAVGMIALCSVILWAIPRIIYKIKHKRYKPTIEELELIHLKEMHALQKERLQETLNNATTQIIKFEKHQQDTLNKLVNKL